VTASASFFFVVSSNSSRSRTSETSRRCLGVGLATSLPSRLPSPRPPSQPVPSSTRIRLRRKRIRSCEIRTPRLPSTTATCSSDISSGSAASATSAAPAMTSRPPLEVDTPEVVAACRRSPCFASRTSTTWLPGCASKIQHRRRAVSHDL